MISRHQFTPAAQRAIDTAARWSCEAESQQLGLPQMLLGLLAEPECRAALLLAQVSIDTAAVQEGWPSLRPCDTDSTNSPPLPSAALLEAFDRAEQKLYEYPRPLALATEHVLLGIASTGNEVAAWLSDRGLQADWLEAEVHRLSGHHPGPLPFEEEIGDSSEVYSSAAGSSKDKNHTGSVDEALQVVRILDAAANRAAEGLRVVEDYLRFALDDRHLTVRCKSLRHELAAIVSRSTAELHSARESQADVGAELTVKAEGRRYDLHSVMTANFKRAEQAMRSLEEYFKVSSDLAIATAIERLRYRTYTLERAVSITHQSLNRLGAARLYVLMDDCGTEEHFRKMAECLVGAGVHLVQLRAKRTSDRNLIARARLLRALTRGTQTLFIMNDRPDLAVLSHADGVHVGQGELSVKDVRTIVGSGALVGVSTHSIEQARQAVMDGANYIGVGPTFPSATKHFDEFTGIGLLRAVAAEIRLPAFAIGGIDSENLSEVLSAGIARVAIGSAVTKAEDPQKAIERVREVLRAGSI